MNKQLFVILALFISYSFSSYDYPQTSYYFTNGNFTAMAMSDGSWTNKQLIKVDVAIGTSKGEVVFLNSDDPDFSYSIFTMMDGPILWMDWSSAGLLISTNRTAQVIDPYDRYSMVTITPSDVINNAIHAYRKSDGMKMIALSLSNRIQIYENNMLAMNISTNFGKKTMCFDNTGRYLYYFDNNYRYVISIVNRTVFGKTYTPYNYTSLAASTRFNYEDITAAVSSSGTATVWDDYGLLYSYSSSVSKMVTFSENSDYMITSQYGYITVRPTSFSSNIGYWGTDQTISLSTFDIAAMAAKNRKLIIVPKQSLFINYSIVIYKRNTSSSQLALFVVIGIAGVAIIAGIAQCIVRKCKKANTNQYQAFNDQSAQGFNSNTSNQYNPGYQPYPNQYVQPAPYQPTNQYVQPGQHANQQNYPYFGNNNNGPVYPNSQNPYATS